jgi:hypothetical protein
MKLYAQVFDLDGPMTWKTFNKLPVTRQIEYLTRMKYERSATNDMLCEMFGVHKNIVQCRCRDLGLSFRLMGKPTQKTKEEWNAWLQENNGKQFLYTIDLMAMPRKEVEWG